MRLVRVGRRRDDAQRCAYCHGGLQDDAAPVACDRCGARLHADCWSELGRCPARGCAGARADAPTAAAAPATASEPAAAPLRVWPPSAAALARRLPPGASARGALQADLARGILSAGCVTLALGSLLLLALSHPADLWHTLSHEHGREVSWPQAAFNAVLMFGFLGLFLVSSARWLWRYPGVRREVERLLDHTRPVAMVLQVRQEGRGRRQHTVVDLTGDGEELTIPLDSGFAAGERWVRTHAGETVLVYGLPPPGPYVFEFQDGTLALLHPD